MRKRYLLLPLFAFVCTLPCAAQVGSGAKVHDVVFRVVDAPTGTPLSGVIVRKPPSGLQTSTNSEGKLSLRTRGSGTLVLEFTKAGYRTAVRVTHVDRTREIVVQLVPDAADAAASWASVEGVVLDGETGTPVEAAGITSSLPELFASSDSSGGFSFPRVPPGRLRLVFSRLGYADREVSVETEAGTQVDLRVELANAPIEMDSLSVTAERRNPAAKTERESLGASTVISDFGTAQNVAEVLQWHVPGLQVSRDPTGSVSVQIRGTASLENQGQPLIVLDGMPVDTALVSWTLSRLHPAQIERIEVLRDVASTSIHGTRGAHGVILIDTKRR